MVQVRISDSQTQKYSVKPKQAFGRGPGQRGGGVKSTLITGVLLLLLLGAAPQTEDSIIESKSVTSNLPGEPCTESVEVCVPYWRGILEKRGSIQIVLNVDQAEEGAREELVTIISVTPGGAGDRAGYRVGDRVLAINGVELGPHPEPALDRLLAKQKIGETVVHRVKRDGQELELSAVAVEPSPSATNQWLFFCVAETFGFNAGNKFIKDHDVRFSPVRPGNGP
jgi:hypothetical protein